MMKKFRFGIISCLIGVLNWSFAGLLLYEVNGGKLFLNRLLGDGPVLGLVVFPVLFLVIPLFGNIIGLLFGLGELLLPNAQKHFAIIGILINIVIPIIILIGFLFVLYGNMGVM